MRTTYTRKPDEDPQTQARWDEDRKDWGWAAPEIWNLGEALGAWLGSALQQFYVTDHPITVRPDSYWAELLQHADALAKFGDFDDEKRLLARLHSENTPEIHAEMEARTEAAQNALRWVADNLDALWS